jgi:hypothetical protein
MEEGDETVKVVKVDEAAIAAQVNERASKVTALVGKVGGEENKIFFFFFFFFFSFFVC